MFPAGMYQENAAGPAYPPSPSLTPFPHLPPPDTDVSALLLAQLQGIEDIKAEVTRLNTRVELLEQKVQALEDAEVSGDPQKPVKLMLACTTKHLNAIQKKTRREIQNHVKKDLEAITGIQQKKALPTPEEAEEAWNAYKSVDRDPTVVFRKVSILPCLDEDAGHIINKTIIKGVADLVHLELRTKSLELSHPDTTYTWEDVRAFAMMIFDTWKKRFERETKPEKMGKYKEAGKKNRRKQRRRMKKQDLLLAVPAYKEEYGVDPEPLIHSDYMTDDVSDLDSGTEEEKIAHRNLKVRQAKLTAKEIADNVPVFETVKWGFLSEEIRTVYDQLKEIRRRQKKHEVARTGYRPQTKRIDLGNFNNDPPARPPYPFMVDPQWYNEHVRDKGVPFASKKNDPAGFGANANNGINF